MLPLHFSFAKKTVTSQRFIPTLEGLPEHNTKQGHGKKYPKCKHLNNSWRCQADRKGLLLLKMHLREEVMQHGLRMLSPQGAEFLSTLSNILKIKKFCSEGQDDHQCLNRKRTVLAFLSWEQEGLRGFFQTLFKLLSRWRTSTHLFDWSLKLPCFLLAGELEHKIFWHLFQATGAPFKANGPAVFNSG